MLCRIYNLFLTVSVQYESSKNGNNNQWASNQIEMVGDIMLSKSGQIILNKVR